MTRPATVLASIRVPSWFDRPAGRNAGRSMAIALAAAVLSACATYEGVAEFTVYRDAYDSAADTGDTILDRLAVAEQKLFAIAYPFDPLRSDFNPDTASYVAASADPPATAAYRRTLQAIESYNEALFGLASGQTADEIAGKIARLGAVGTGAASDIASIVGGGAATIAAATAINTVLAGFEPLAAEVIGFGTRDAFREQLVERAPIIREAIGQVRASTVRVFGALRDEVFATATNDPSRTGLTADELEQIKGYRSLLANWVVLLDASAAAFEVAVIAAQSPGGIGSYDGMLLASENLAAAVRSARTALAEDN